MKKFLLTVMLLAATYGAGAAEPGFADPGALQCKLPPVTTTEQATKVVHSALDNYSAPDSSQLVKLPETAMKTPVRRESGEHQWGEWYTFRTGTLDSQYPYVYNSLMDITFPLQVKLLRRDASDDATASQLRIEGFLDEYDIFFYWDTESGLIQWDPVDLTGFENPYEADTPITFREHLGSYYYSPKTVMKLNAFINLMSSQAGYYGYLTFTPEDQRDAALDFTFTATDAEAGEVEVSFNTVGSDIAEIRYGLVYANSVNYVVPEFSRVYAYGTLFDIKTVVMNNFSDFDITSLPGKGGVTRKHTVDRSGLWAVGVLLLDKEGEVLGFYVKDLKIGLSEPEKWEDAGMVTFTESDFSLHFEALRNDYAAGYIRSLTLPEWADATLRWKVPLQKSKETPGLYRLVNPYTCEGAPVSDGVIRYETAENSFEQTIAFDKSHNYYYIFDVQNPERPWAYMTPTGIWFNGEEHPLSGMESVNQNRAPENYQPGGLRYDEEGRIFTDYNKFEILLPGYVDYSVDFDTTWKDLLVKTMGSGVARVKYTVLRADADSEGIYDRIDAGAEDLTIGTATQTGALDLSGFDIVPEDYDYTIYAVTYDAAGNRRKEASYFFVLYKHDYKVYSQAKLRESMLEDLFNVPGGFYDVWVYVADDAEGHYFVLDPYRNHPELGYYTNRTGTFMDIDCSDPERVNIPEYTVPMQDVGSGTMKVQSMSNYYMTVGGHTADEVAEAGYFGSFREGQVKLPARGAAIYLEKEGKYYSGCTANVFCLRFPWYVDYGFDLVNEHNKLTVNNIENGVDRIAYAAVEQGSMTDAELMLAFQEGRIERFTLEEDGEIDLAQHGFEAFRRYSVAVASFDTDGNLREYKTADVYLEGDYVAAGTGIYTDPFLQFIFKKEEIEDLLKPREVELYTCAEAPGMIFVKDPFTDVPASVGLPYCLSEYLPIDVTDPARVFIPRDRFGIASGRSSYFMYSQAEVYRSQGTAEEDIPAEAFGTLSRGKIVIPVEALVYVMADSSDPAAHNPALVLELPENLSGVEAVGAEAASGEPEYYDLQGRRVKNPAAGFYIERRGATVKKVFIR